MTRPPPWLRPWREVFAIYASAERQKDRRRREAAAHGINTKVKEKR